MTYAEVFEWMEDNFEDYDEYWDAGEQYEHLENEWDGRANLSDIISFEDFINHYQEDISWNI